MQYRFSLLADPGTYDNEGLCANVPIRLHKNQDLEERGIIRAQQDWREHVGSLDFYRCTMGKYTYMSCTLPECLPDRLEVISYANEISFMYDDLIDTGDSEEVDEENKKMIDAFEEAAETGTIVYKSSGKRILQAKILTEMLKIDRERAIVAMKAWAEYLESSGRSHEVLFDRLDDFLGHRARDAGEKFVFAIITFGMGLTIPEEEHQILHEMCLPCFAHLTLVNDLYSYDKELEAAIVKGDKTWLNALNVLMREHSIGIDEAKVICRERIQKAAAEFMIVVQSATKNEELSLDLRRYIEALQCGMSGNLAWSMTCPRYNKSATYTKRQLELMKMGLEKPITPSGENASSPKQAKRPEATPAGHHQHKKPRLATPSASSSSSGKSQSGKWDGIDTSTTSLESNLVFEDLPALSATIVKGPIEYIDSLPGKNIRGKIIDALNVWFQLPRQTIRSLKSLVNSLHSASLMLDDIEDCSNLRRGMPAAHFVFGHAQTINSAGYGIYQALAEVASLRNPACTTVFIEEMGNAYIGQSYDLHWTSNLICPTLSDYLAMIDAKTGGLFRLLARLMEIESRSPKQPDTTRLVTLVGRYFQIRDDYQNLNDADYTKQKGFCEDLDEGKYSFMLIHALQSAKPDRQAFLSNLLMQRRVAGGMTHEQKQLVLKEMKDIGSFEYTIIALRKMLTEIECEIAAIEQYTGLQNVELGLLIELLRM